MAHPKIAIHPRIRHADGCPARASQLDPCKVEGGDIVGVVLESTFDTSEEGLGSPVSSINVSASRASLRSILWVGINYRYPSFKGFVFDKGLELSESPAVEISVLAFSMFSSISNASQLLHNDYIAFPKAVHKFTADLMQNSINPSSLLSTQPFQSAFSRLRAFRLERRAELSKMVSSFEGVSPFHLEAVGGNEKIAYTDVDAYGVIAFTLWDFPANCDMKIKRFISVNQNSMCGLSVFKKLSLIFSYVKRNFNSLLNSRDRRIDAIRLIDKPKKPLVQIHRKLRKLKELVLSLFVGFGNPVSRSDGEVRWKIELLPRLPVNHVVESNWIEHFSFKGYLGDVVASISKSVKRVQQLLRIFNRWLKLAYNRLRELHTKAYMQFNI